MKRMFATVILAAVATATAACSSIKLPSLDMLDSAFQDSQTDLADYPSVSQAPVIPSDLRPKGDWDVAAKTVMASAESFSDIPDTDAPVNADALYDDLVQEVRAYKLDDPVE